MMKKIKSIGLLLLLFAGQIAMGQTNQVKALAKGQEAIELMEKGKLDESIKLLEEAQKLDPDRFDFPYEMAYAYYAKEDYKEAMKILEKNKTHKDATDNLYQLLGNCYDILGKTEKAFETYDAGLKIFPNSGKIYLEKGNIYWAKEEYGKALQFYEKGIEVEPKFPSNYYRASRIYCGSSEEVWGMIYGELFMNLERNSKRTSEISKLLYDTYKKAIVITNDTSFSVSFSKQTTMNTDQLSKMKLPYGIGVYEPTIIYSMLSVKTIDLNSLDIVRSEFIENYIKLGHDKTYPNVLFAFQKKIKDAGHIEAYNYWILMKGEEESFANWKLANKNKWDGFAKWFNENGLIINENNKFYSGQY